MPVLRFTSDALDNMAEIAEYIARASGSVTVADNFIERLISKCENLALLPGTMGRARPELRPELRSSSFQNYVIFFRYQSNLLEVANVLEGHRDIDAYFEEHDQ